MLRTWSYRYLRNQHLYNLDLHPGHIFCKYLVSLRLALDLGCILKYSVCTKYSCLTHQPLVVHSLTILKVRIRGPFAPNPHWVHVEAIEYLDHPWILNGDIALSRSTQRKHWVHTLVFSKLYLRWKKFETEIIQFEAFGGVFLNEIFTFLLFLVKMTVMVLTSI